MIRLVTFGGPVLVNASGQSIECILAQPRRLALLTYLALETRKAPVRRDVIIGIFWPEVSQARASRSLSQAIHFLRKALGDSALSEPGRCDVRINATALTCDACAFLAALESQHFAEAVDLYSGDFLRGLYVDGAAEFEEWAEEQRAYLRRRASEAAMIEARRAAAAGRSAVAASYARRATELGLFAEPLVREQMELLDSVGDTAGALEAYEQLRRRLRRDLLGEPAAETVQIAERLRQRNVAEVAPVPAATPRVLAPSQPAKSENRAARWWRKYPRLAAAAAAVIALGGILSAWGLRRGEPLSADGAAVLLIDDLVEAGSVPPGYAEALTTQLVSELTPVPGISARHVLGAPHAMQGRVSAGDPLVLRGYVGSTTWQQGLQVNVHVVNGLTGEVVAAREFRVKDVDAEALPGVANKIVDFARAEIGRYHREEHLADVSPRHVDAVRQAAALRVRGDSLRSDGEAEQALAAFKNADAILATISGGRRTAARVLAERSDVWLTRAWVFFTPQAFDIAAFRTAAKRAVALADSALDLDDEAALALETKGFASQMLWQTESPDAVVALRQFIEMAEQSLRGAVNVAPARARAWALLGAVFYVQGEYAKAFDAAERAYTADAFLEQSPEVLHRLQYSALEIGQHGTARAWCDEIARRYASSWMEADCRLQLLAWSKPTRAQFEAARKLVAQQKSQRAQPTQLITRLEMVLGVIAAKAGLSPDSALAIQNRAMALSPQDPELAPVRAWLWRSLNRPDSVSAIVNAYVAADPHRRAGILKSRRFQPSHGPASRQVSYLQ